MRNTWKNAVFATLLVLASQAFAGQEILQEFHSASKAGNNQVTVHSNGDITANVKEPAHEIAVSIKLVGHVAILTTKDGITSSSSVVDLDSMDAWTKSHPSLAYELGSLKLMATKARRGSLAVSGGVLQASGGRCGTQLKTMLDAADTAVSTCAMGGGLLCAAAVSDYGKAKDAYYACAGTPGATGPG